MDSLFFAPQTFDQAAPALAYVQQIYQAGLQQLRRALQDFLAGQDIAPVRACYPLLRLRVGSSAREQRQVSRLAYGFVAGPGVFETTLTRPELFARYYLEQFELLLQNHAVELEVCSSKQPIPLHFALDEQTSLDSQLAPERRRLLRSLFDFPELADMDDGIANGTQELPTGAPQPLALFTAPRVDYSLHRLRHYTGTSPEHFQNFVLFTNYQFYIDEFVKLGQALMRERPDPARPHELDDCIALVEPGNRITRRVGLSPEDADALGQLPPRLPQMPAYHLIRRDRSGISLINIGVGPANAKTITDHVAVLRPHAWLMLGHCAGLRNSQQLGDYVLAHAYVREDHVLDEDLPLWVPIPPLAEVQVALETAVADITQLSGLELKRLLRTGTVASTDNRNWELLPKTRHGGPERRFSQSRAVALDMESATIAANGLRLRVPYGTLLCVSDKPLHGEIKLPGMADQFYRARVDQHLQIGLRAVELLRQGSAAQLHSRKLRSFAEVAFQ
ncbi:AMP nucleosidase [Paucibacter sp. DJ1R-11]|uniref:AMP nucleosidase n=1 Tax=Paucibacter sp. DJ1R-11 TaxID=2893556 RepID=UPI0021E361BF|nr:AMP nucleosidase [Paucibacter sp. DJ1R-11]MCV2366195.1 AMP nucleosidase [Paucibacter sp. DJ1R-11]